MSFGISLCFFLSWIYLFVSFFCVLTKVTTIFFFWKFSSWKEKNETGSSLARNSTWAQWVWAKATETLKTQLFFNIYHVIKLYLLFSFCLFNHTKKKLTPTWLETFSGGITGSSRSATYAIISFWGHSK